MKHEQFLKVPSIFIKKKADEERVAPEWILHFLNQWKFCQRYFVVQYVLLLNAKDTTDPIKHQASIVDETWAILKNSINFHKKADEKKVARK